MAKRSSSHTRAQKNGKIRDGYTCQACGSKNKVEGHHIIDHQFSGAAQPITLFRFVTIVINRCITGS